MSTLTLNDRLVCATCSFLNILIALYYDNTSPSVVEARDGGSDR